MADEGTAAATRRPAIFAGAAHPWVGRIRVALIGVCAAGILLVSASQTVLGRYVYYRAEDAAAGARKSLRQTVDAAHNWWHHVKKTVAQRDRRRAPTADPERWVGMIDVPPR